MEILDSEFSLRNSLEGNEQWRNLKAEEQQLQKKIKTGVVAICLLIFSHTSSIIRLWDHFESSFLIGYFIVIVLIYLGSVGYVKANPKVAMTVPLITMIMLHVFWTLVNPANFTVALIYKLIIGAFLLRARSAADHLDMATFQIEQLEKQYNKTKIPIIDSGN